MMVKKKRRRRRETDKEESTPAQLFWTCLSSSAVAVMSEVLLRSLSLIFLSLGVVRACSRANWTQCLLFMRRFSASAPPPHPSDWVQSWRFAVLYCSSVNCLTSTFISQLNQHKMEWESTNKIRLLYSSIFVIYMKSNQF